MYTGSGGFKGGRGWSMPTRCTRCTLQYCHTASRSDDFDVDRRPCSDSRHVTAPYKLALYYYYFIIIVASPTVRLVCCMITSHRHSFIICCSVSVHFIAMCYTSTSYTCFVILVGWSYSTFSPARLRFCI